MKILFSSVFVCFIQMEYPLRSIALNRLRSLFFSVWKWNLSLFIPSKFNTLQYFQDFRPKLTKSQPSWLNDTSILFTNHPFSAQGFISIQILRNSLSLIEKITCLLLCMADLKCACLIAYWMSNWNIVCSATTSTWGHSMYAKS